MSKKGFTLIEVMVAVMIISVVIAALLQLQANNTHIFLRLQKMEKAQQYLSLLSESKYGLENDTLTLDRLIERFDVDDELRRELKNVRAEVVYQRVDTIDLSQIDQNLSEMQEEETQIQNPMRLEIGRTILRIGDASTQVVRVRIP